MNLQLWLPCNEAVPPIFFYTGGSVPENIGHIYEADFWLMLTLHHLQASVFLFFIYFFLLLLFLIVIS